MKGIEQNVNETKLFIPFPRIDDTASRWRAGRGAFSEICEAMNPRLAILHLIERAQI